MILSGLLLKLCPPELLGRSTPVAIRASDITLCDLPLHSRPRTITDHSRDRLSLQRRISVIELENDWIGLAAVDAGVIDEIVEHALTTVFAIAFSASSRPLQIAREVATVVFACVRGLARATLRPAGSALLVLDGELLERSGSAARATDPGGICGRREEAFRCCVDRPPYFSVQRLGSHWQFGLASSNQIGARSAAGGNWRNGRRTCRSQQAPGSRALWRRVERLHCV
jgi:hypothetical protein